MNFSLMESSPQKVQMRRQLILDTLRDHPWVSCRFLTNRILEETGGAPALLTGAIYISPATMYADLCYLEKAQAVTRKQFSARSILWSLT